MEISCASLGDAYQAICRQYAKEGREPGLLQSIGFASGWTCVDATGGQRGLAFHFNGAHGVYGPVDPAPLTGLQPFMGQSLYRLTEHLLLQKGLLFRSACVAALNALSHPFTARASLLKRGIPLAEDEELDFIKPGDQIALIGYGRVIGALHRKGMPFHVWEMRPQPALRTLAVGEEICWGPADVHFHAAGEEAALLAEADIVLITGSTLVNDTLPGLLAQCAGARIIGLFGPSAGLLPEYLLGLGIKYILYDCSQAPQGLTQVLTEGEGRHSLGDCFETVVIKAF